MPSPPYGRTTHYQVLCPSSVTKTASWLDSCMILFTGNLIIFNTLICTDLYFNEIHFSIFVVDSSNYFQNWQIWSDISYLSYYVVLKPDCTLFLYLSIYCNQSMLPAWYQEVQHCRTFGNYVLFPQHKFCTD